MISAPWPRHSSTTETQKHTSAPIKCCSTLFTYESFLSLQTINLLWWFSLACTCTWDTELLVRLKWKCGSHVMGNFNFKCSVLSVFPLDATLMLCAKWVPDYCQIHLTQALRRVLFLYYTYTVVTDDLIHLSQGLQWILLSIIHCLINRDVESQE